MMMGNKLQVVTIASTVAENENVWGTLGWLQQGALSDDEAGIAHCCQLHDHDTFCHPP